MGQRESWDVVCDKDVFSDPVVQVRYQERYFVLTTLLESKIIKCRNNLCKTNIINMYCYHVT
jgi:hypothetical protein